MNNIILTGFMGSGKTSTGIRLSRRLQCPVVDTDRLIEQETGKKIPRIFAEEGEAYFRDLETKTLKKLAEGRERRIISTGGGLPVRPQNRPLLRALGTVVYLCVQPGTVYERLRGDTGRPLLQCEDPAARIREMMAAREDAYREAAHVIIQADGMTFEEIIKEIEERIR